jgi:hypothetical protein
MGKRSRKRHAPGDIPPPRRSGEERNAEIRERLEPFAAGERPGVLTLASAVAALLAATNLGAYLIGVEVDGEKPPVVTVLLFCGVLFAAAVGMWQMRYWAVLGFQTLLGLILVVFFLLLLTAGNVLAVVVAIVVEVFAGWLFWKLVRVMARLQMPTR